MSSTAAKANAVELYTVSSLSRDDDIEREIDYVRLEAMFVKFRESITNRGEVCPDIRRCLAIACKLVIYREVLAKPTLNARIMCPGLMVRAVFTRETEAGERVDFWNADFDGFSTY